MMRILSRFICVLAVAASLAVSAEAKKKDKKDTEPVKSAYAQLTGTDTLKMSGLMNVVTKKDTTFLEMPVELLGKAILVVNRLQQVPKELNESGVNKGINYENQVVRFEWDKQKKTVTIRQQRVTPQVAPDDAMARSVRDNYIDPIIAVIKVRAVGPDSASVVFPVDKLFNGSDACLNDVFHSLNISNSPNSSLSRILSVKSHENSVTATSELTTMVREGNERVFVTVVVSTSLMLLPEQPMMGREESSRVGYFTDDVLSFSDSQQYAKTLHYINRWRLEPADVEAYLRGELTPPKKPIVFYLDRCIPAAMRPYIRQGILDWNEAFECAGFRDAVRVEEMTDSMEREDDDLKYSVITYAASEKANAMGPCITDPRSGEILEADVVWWHNVKKLLRQWIIVQTAAVNPAARQPQLPDSIIGDAVRFVASHEVGHSLGLRHNMRASAAYPTDSLRSQSFIDRMGGISASIMDYARFNYVAQPGDGVRISAPRIGPYDKMAVEWGYRWYPSEVEARIALSQFLREHKGKEYMYSETGGFRQAINPDAMSEDLGDDPVKSANYGLANLKRIMPNITAWTRTGDIDQTWDDAAELWSQVIGQWDLYNYHVLANVGGIYLENTVVNDGKQTFTYVPAERQRASVKYLIDNVFTEPKWLFPSELSSRTYLLKHGREEHPMTALRVEQSFLFWDLMSNERIIRMLQAESDLGAAKAFTAVDMMDMLHKAMFTDIPNPDIKQRAVQKDMVDALITAASKGEGIKVSKGIAEENAGESRISGTAGLYGLPELCSNALTSRPRNIYMTNSQMTRTSDALSVKRGELLRIRAWAKAKAGEGRTALQMHCADLIQRIEAALGLQPTK
mgnify:CR=1 FL=1